MKPAALRTDVLSWYDANARELPWRIGPHDRALGLKPDPYRVWLSEVMLQQTTTTHATRYFHRFVARWPSVRALADAPEAEVMGAWAGLGYYARARNLIACARVVAGAGGGVFPDHETALRALPGFGPYTAAAVAAIAFDRPANVVDGNVERVVARLHKLETATPAAKRELRTLAAQLVTTHRPGDWAQALMDLGATICRPKAPLCPACPAAAHCLARIAGNPGDYPRQAPKIARTRRYGAAFVLVHGGRVALVRRPARGLLGGMLGLPTDQWTAAETPASPPFAAAWRSVGTVEHVFTHFPLTLRVLQAEGPAVRPDLVWLSAAEALGQLPTVFAKALRCALGGGPPVQAIGD